MPGTGERPRLPLTFGEGVDRASGALVVRPDAFQDLRNLYARDGKLAVRPGLAGTPFTALGWGTDVIGVFCLQATKDVLLVVYDRATRELRIYRANPAQTYAALQKLAGGAPLTTLAAGLTITKLKPDDLQLAGTWGTLPVGSPFPRVVGDEYDGRFFFAHDEATYASRLKTIYYTPNAVDTVVGALADLTSDLDSSGAAEVLYFRGVVTYNDSLWGWGFGAGVATDRDRPEIIRQSVPGNPLLFKPEALYYAGAKADPVVACVPVGGAGSSILAVRKTYNSFRIIGTDPETYGIEPADARFGAEAARLCVAAGDTTLVWTASGPRALRGDGSSEDLALPLELDGPRPEGMAAAGQTAYGFAIWEPEARLARFCFPDVAGATTPTVEYTLSLRDPSRPRWSYAEIEQCVVAAGTQVTGKVTVTAIDGTCGSVAAADAGLAPDGERRRVIVSWSNTAARGDETAEVWRRVTGSGTAGWAIATAVPVAGSPQAVELVDADALQRYDYAVRLTLDGLVAAGFSGATPDAWTSPAALSAKALNQQTNVGVPTAPSAAWRRTSPTTSEVTLAWTLDDTTAPLVVERQVNGGAFVEVATLAGTTRATVYQLLPGELGQTLGFVIRPVRAAVAAGLSSPLTLLFGGPALLPVVGGSVWATPNNLSQDVTSPAGSAVVEIQTSPTGTVWTTRATKSPSPAQPEAILLPGARTAEPSILVRGRVGVSTHGVLDYGDYSAPEMRLYP